MCCTVFKLSSREKKSVNTEMLFYVATARSSAKSIFRVDIDAAEEDVIKHICSVLKSAKKKKLIEIYVSRDEIGGNGTAAIYITNKHPEILSDIIPKNTSSFYVKI